MKKILLTLLAAFYLLTPLFALPQPAHAQSLEDLGLLGDSYKYGTATLTADDLSLLPGGGDTWKEGDKILFITGVDNSGEFERTQAFIVDKTTLGNDDIFFEYAGPSAGHRITVKKNDLSKGTYSGGGEISIAGPETAQTYIDEQNDETPPPSDENGEPEASCSGLALIGWVLCPLIDGLYNAISSLFEAISKNFLVVDPLSDDAGSADDPQVVIYNIWNSFRILANIGFVVIFLIAILGNAYGFLLDAYDFKKVVPRLGLAFIGVQVSWYICAFMIDFFNVMGAGVRALMLTPVEGLQRVDLDFGSLGEVVGVLTAGGAAALVQFTVGIKGLLGMLPFILLPIVLAIVFTLFVLAVRQMLIFLLVVTSPVAFVAGILPGTEKIFKTWWDLFWKALVMYPLIIALIAAGELTAKLVVAGDQDNPLFKVIGVVALFAPYFLIPSTFKFAGNLITNVASGFQRASHKIRDTAFGDVRDPFSYRARQRSQRQKYRTQNTGEFIARNRAQMPTSLRGEGGIIGGTVNGVKHKSALRGRGVRGAIGGAVGGAYLRSGLGGNIDEQLAGRTANAFEWAKDVGGVQTEALMAQLGYGRYEQTVTNPVTGKQERQKIPEPFYGSVIPQQYVNEATAHKNDAARTTAALGMLLTKAGSSENVHALRKQMNRMVEHGDLTPEQAHNAWEVASHHVQQMHDDLKYRDYKTGKIEKKYVSEFLRKTTDTQMSYHIENQRGTFWEGLGESYQQLQADPSVPEADRAKQSFNKIRDNTIKDLTDSYTFKNRESIAKMLDAQGINIEFNALLADNNRPVLNNLLGQIAATEGKASVEDLVIDKAMNTRQTVGAFNEMRAFLKGTRNF